MKIRPEKFVIGVTGGFGAGKSSVCRMMSRLGALWIESDKIVHELYAPGKEGYKKIAGYFGKEFVDPKKGVKRDKLRRVVLQNPQKLWILEKLIHPALFHELNKKIVQAEEKVICVESLYFEKDDLGKFVDKIIEIRRDPKLIRKSRTMEGRWDLDDINRFMRLSPIFPKADFIIENNGSFTDLEEKITSLGIDQV